MNWNWLAPIYKLLGAARSQKRSTNRRYRPRLESMEDRCLPTATASFAATDPAVANPDSYVVQENGSLAVLTGSGVLANDTDADGYSLSASLFNGPGHGSLNLGTDGSFTYTPQAGYIGIDSFTYTASDGQGGSSTATVTLTVSGPVYAFGDAYAAVSGTTLNVSATQGVLHNDVDFDNFFGIPNQFAASLLTGPSHGAISFSADGSFSYTPDAGYSSADGFTYQASNGLGGTASASVYLNVSPSANVFLVTRTLDSDETGLSNAPGTLRWAITQANLQASSRIDFAIPTTDPGYNPTTGTWTIEVSSGVSLPPIGENTGVVPASSVLIDGWSQGGPGYQGPPLIILDGSQTDNQTGLSIGDVASDVTIRGLTIQNFHADFLPDEGAGLSISAPGANAQIYGDEFLNNDTYGILVYANSSGDTFQDNVISGNGFGGIWINSDNNLIAGNTITDNGAMLPPQDPYEYAGTVPATGFGIWLTGGDNIIGQPGAGNVISGNDGPGLWIYSGGNTIQGNEIGTDTTGANPMGNTGSGILLDLNASDNLIGGTQSGDGNVIADNSEAGVSIDGGSKTFGDRINGNSIFGNGQLGIALAADGANLEQNYPVLTSVTSNNGRTTIDGTLTGTASTTYRVEFFANPSADVSGFGQGQDYLGSASVQTDNSGDATFSVKLPVAVLPHESISATATNPAGNTSAFSADVAVNAPPTVAITPPTGTVTFASPITFTFQFSEAVMGFTSGDIKITNGRAVAFTAVNRTTYTEVVRPTGYGTVSVAVAGNAAKDAAGIGNTGASASVVYGQTFTTTTTLASSLNSAMIGQNVTFTATIRATGQTPQGTVTFLDNGTPIDTVTLVNGVGTTSTAALTSGTHTITASYSGFTQGSTRFAASQTTLNEVVLNSILSSSQVRILGPLLPVSLGSGRLQVVYTITNITGAAINAPIHLTFTSLPPGVTLVGSTSLTGLGIGQTGRVTVTFATSCPLLDILCAVFDSWAFSFNFPAVAQLG